MYGNNLMSVQQWEASLLGVGLVLHLIHGAELLSD